MPVLRLASFVLCAFLAVVTSFIALRALEQLHQWPFTQATLGLIIVGLTVGIPTLLVGRFHPHLTRAHLLAYAAILLTLLVLMVLLNMNVEL